ncbi:MAG: hypothetical protein RLZZ299_2772 [Pseudomonadota bacterium]
MRPPLLLLAILAACAPDPRAAPEGSRSADLALRAEEVARKADALATRARALEGMYDSLRAAPDAARPALRAQIRDVADALQAESRAIRDEVVRIEAGARVYDIP